MLNAGAMGPHAKLKQKSIAAFPKHAIAECAVDQIQHRPGIIVDVTSGKRKKQETHESKAFERREALPEFERIIEALVERDAAKMTHIKSRGKSSKGTHKRRNESQSNTILD